MLLWPILAFFFAFVEAIAVSKNLLRLEYMAKPAVMICLFLWLCANTGLQGRVSWFGLGILFSLVGDVLLIISLESIFLLGLIAFLFAHISYIIGLRQALATLNVLSLIPGIFIVVSAGGLLRRIVGAMRAKGENNLVIPVIVYGIVISMMLYAAISTIYDPGWKTSAAFVTSVAAFLFVASDAILAWNKFVSLAKHGRVWSITLYYLGQIGLVAGVVSQFG